MDSVGGPEDEEGDKSKNKQHITIRKMCSSTEADWPLWGSVGMAKFCKPRNLM